MNGGAVFGGRVMSPHRVAPTMPVAIKRGMAAIGLQPAPSRQYGQSLLLTVVLMAAGGLMWLLFYQVGQVAGERARLTHVADAMAYSGAVAQARSLNLLAYINRAEVAHQVAMAHLVTMASWAQFGQTQSQQAAARHPQPSLIRRLFGVAAGNAYARARVSGDIAPELAHAFQAHDAVVHQVLARASVSVAGSMAQHRQQLMQQVLAANYPDYPTNAPDFPSRESPRFSVLSDGLAGAVTGHTGNEPGPLRDAIEQAAARQAFLQRRKVTHRNRWSVDERCSTRRHELRRRGRTWLDENGRWVALDTLSFHAVRSNRWIGCYYREYPMGWGQHQSSTSTFAADRPPQFFSKQHFWRWVREHTSWDLHSGRSNALANAHALFDALKWHSRGLPTYHMLDSHDRYRALRFAIQVQRSRRVSFPAKFEPRLEKMHSDDLSSDSVPGAMATVQSAAEAYFVAPSSSDSHGQSLASLFRPFWQARLSTAEVDERSAGER